MISDNQWKILEPIKIGNILCKNRVMMAAHSPGHVDEQRLPTDDLIYYLEERARGGVGVIVIGGTSVSQEGALVERIVVNVNDAIIPWYQKIAQAVHKYGTLVFEQLMHVGGQLDAYEESRVVAPSVIPHELCNAIPVELTIKEIERIVGDFSAAAQRTKRGGLDGIEIKCDQGFLIHQFLSPYYNRRSDKYGGDDKRRIRFLFEVMESVRGAVGHDFVVGVRVTGDSMTPGDLTLDDAVRIVQDIEKTGLVDYVHVNGGSNSSYPAYLVGHGDSTIGHMNFATAASRIKRSTNLPVIAASMITHPYEAEQLIVSGTADMVAMTRPLITEPELINKLRENRLEDIRPCVLCNQGCVGNHWKGANVHCIHNPATGRERALGVKTISQAEKKKKIAVIGGGPAGLEFARIASLRGHKVELYEKQKSVGGQVLLAAKLPWRLGLLDIAHYLERQIKELGVRIYCGVEVSVDDLIVASSDYEAIVVATGSKLYIPPTYDVESSNALTIRDMLENGIELGEHILVVSIDWRQNALAVAEWLFQQGRKVTLISRGFFVGEGLDVVTLTSYYSRLHGNVQFLPLTELEALREKRCYLRHVLSNKIQELYPIDQIIFVTGATPDTSLYLGIKDQLSNVFCVGDCVTPRGIPEAMLEANRLARRL